MELRAYEMDSFMFKRRTTFENNRRFNQLFCLMIVKKKKQNHPEKTENIFSNAFKVQSTEPDIFYLSILSSPIPIMKKTTAFAVILVALLFFSSCLETTFAEKEREKTAHHVVRT